MTAEELQRPPGMGNNHPQELFPAAGTLPAASRQRRDIYNSGLGRPDKNALHDLFPKLEGQFSFPAPFFRIKGRNGAFPAPMHHWSS